MLLHPPQPVLVQFPLRQVQFFEQEGMVKVNHFILYLNPYSLFRGSRTHYECFLAFL